MCPYCQTEDWLPVVAHGERADGQMAPTLYSPAYVFHDCPKASKRVYSEGTAFTTDFPSTEISWRVISSEAPIPERAS